ncbi:hypothetical protein [Endozoicomonas lisbonensis]|uniref:hypothetical protein n=1 Tax=Endozoicomonas lisbonensis TaxID=3120522 RepID=UPI00339B834E
MSGNDQQTCLDFIKKYPGDYQTEDLEKDSEIYLYNKSNTIFFLDEDSVLPYPITIVSSDRIALFGVKKSDNTKPQLTISEQQEGIPESIKAKGIKAIYKYYLTHPSYYRREIIGSIDQCDSCLISGFSVNRNVQSNNEKIKKIFSIKGSRSVVHLNDIEAAGNTHNESGYFLAKDIRLLTISNFTASSIDSNNLIKPAIEIENTPEIKLKNITIDEVDVMGFTKPTRPKKIISIINPVSFTVSNTGITSSSYGQLTNPVFIGLSISFTNPEKYKTTLVNGVIDQFEFSGFGLITNRAEAIRFDGTPGYWAGLVTEAYRQVKGSVTVKDLTVEDGSIKANKINLPNLLIKGLEEQSASVSTFNNVTSTLPALLIPTLSGQYSSVNHSHSHSSPSIALAPTRQVSLTQAVTPTPVDRGAENRKVCNRLARMDRRLCRKFLEKNPGEFDVQSLAGNTSISIVNQSNKLFLISGTQLLPHPITIANSENIAIFGVNDSEGKQPILRPGKKYKTASYIKEDVIGTVFDCINCIISGFSFKTWISSKSKNTDRLFNVSGKNTIIHFNNLNVNREYVPRYFDINSVSSVKITNMAVKYRDSKSNQIASPAINVVNAGSLDINNVSIVNFDPYLTEDAEGLITLVNPVRFKIRNTTFKGSRFSDDKGYGSIMTPIYVKFNDFNKYKHTRVDGHFNNLSMTRVDGWPSHWAGITLDGRPESLASLLAGQYKNISGTVSIRNTSLPNSGGKVKKKFLPSLWVDDGTSLPPATIPTLKSFSSAATIETAATPQTDTTPVKQTQALSTYSQTIPLSLTTSLISQPLPTTSRASQTGISFKDGKIKPSGLIPAVSVQPSSPLVGRVDTPRLSSNRGDGLSTAAITGISVGATVFSIFVVVGIAICYYQKHRVHGGEASIEMMPQ